MSANAPGRPMYVASSADFVAQLSAGYTPGVAYFFVATKVPASLE
jgi:hypothetical protein